MFRAGLAAVIVVLVTGEGVLAHDVNKAEELYRHTAYEESLTLLDKKSSDFSRYQFSPQSQLLYAGRFQKGG